MLADHSVFSDNDPCFCVMTPRSLGLLSGHGEAMPGMVMIPRSTHVVAGAESPCLNGRLFGTGRSALASSPQVDSSAHSLELLDAQVRECYGRVICAYVAHDRCSEILLCRLENVRLLQIILSSMTTAGCVGVTFARSASAGVAGVVLSFLLLALNAYTKSHDLGMVAQRHRQAAADLWLLREKYLSLITDLSIGGESLDALKARRDELLEELHKVYTHAPAAGSLARGQTWDALRKSGEMSFSDAELDLFLPHALRKG